MKSDRERVLALRMAGASYNAIAEQLDLSVADVESLVADELVAVTTDSRESTTRLEMARLDALMIPVWKQAVRGDSTAVSQALKIIGQRSALSARLEDQRGGVTETDTETGVCLSVADQIAAIKAAKERSQGDG